MQLPKVYEPGEYENDIYALWEKNQAFKPTGQGEPFSIIMPPPNANGSLHWGHAIGYTLTDVITRYKRMQGFKTLWLPGTDHAGIETQFVYERDVLSPKGESRLDYSQDDFFANVMDFTLGQQTKILDQFRSMGFSPDWNKLKFTLDPDVIDIVYDTFKKMHDDGHVYRGNRIVNWCTRCSAAFADIEVEHREQEDAMYEIDYGTVVVATVRPETIFGDVAVAINPKDKRHKGKKGKTATIPLVERPIPIIHDDYVDLETGTGALKVTPGHDHNDYQIGQRHNLPEISVIDFDGKLINVPEKYAGMSVLEGRKAVAEDLKAAGKLKKTTPLVHQVAIHDRCGTMIEPLVSEQWFLRVSELNKPVIKAIKANDVEFFPSRFKQVALNWLEQEHDWCISRDSCWWGIRMPIYYRTSHDDNKDSYIVASTEDEAKKYYGEGNYQAETATFDTWFSSGQWPYATLMTNGDHDFKDFYPTNVMGTARELIHKWVTRMIMFGLYKTGDVPFKQVYLWGLITDEHGKKMSKSKGNVVDPLKITGKYGTDALRLAGAISNTAGTDSPMSEKQVEGMRNFCNKLWNIARFVEGMVDASRVDVSVVKPTTIDDHWMLHKLKEASDSIGKRLDNYQLNEAANALYHLVWDDFADWYIEASKSNRNESVLAYALQTILKLTHPFAPFVTETIWQTLGWQADSLLITSDWPVVDVAIDQKAVQDFELLQKIVTEVRFIAKEMDVKKPTLLHASDDFADRHSGLLIKLGGLGNIDIANKSDGVKITSAPFECWLDVSREDAQAFIAKLQEKIAQNEQSIKQLEGRLKNKNYVDKAPKKLVDETKQQLEDTKILLKTQQSELKRFS